MKTYRYTVSAQYGRQIKDYLQKLAATQSTSIPGQETYILPKGKTTITIQPSPDSNIILDIQTRRIFTHDRGLPALLKGIGAKRTGSTLMGRRNYWLEAVPT